MNSKNYKKNKPEVMENVTKKHSVLTDFFEKVLMLSREEAGENACRIEHVITKNAFNKLKEYTRRNLG